MTSRLNRDETQALQRTMVGGSTTARRQRQARPPPWLLLQQRQIVGANGAYSCSRRRKLNLPLSAGSEEKETQQLGTRGGRRRGKDRRPLGTLGVRTISFHTRQRTQR
ncbi:hypothetical protein MRX96_051729 [Rhipicephalus microplus]